MKSGSVYRGSFKNDQPHGRGIITDSNGTIKEGVWLKGKFMDELKWFAFLRYWLIGRRRIFIKSSLISNRRFHQSGSDHCLIACFEKVQIFVLVSVRCVVLPYKLFFGFAHKSFLQKVIHSFGLGIPAKSRSRKTLSFLFDLAYNSLAVHDWSVLSWPCGKRRLVRHAFIILSRALHERNLNISMFKRKVLEFIFVAV